MNFDSKVIGISSPTSTAAAGMTSILICSDPLMASEKEQLSNRRWLKDILARPIYLATGSKPDTYFSSLTDASRLNREHFFALSSITLDPSANQFWYDDNAINQASLDYLREFLPKRALLIGYELSAQTRRIFSRIGVPYIDIWLHPVRYLDDILFAFGSNRPEVQANLSLFDLDPEHYHLYANRLRVQFYKGYSRPDLKIPPQSALFVGQMLNDKSVLDGGYAKSVLDYREQFSRIASESTKVYYSRHPYLRAGDEQILRFVGSFPNVELANYASYSYLCHPNISTVATISSSVGLEAQYFDKNVEIFFQPMLALGKGEDEYVSIFQSFVSPAFWSKILAPVVPTAPSVTDVGFLDKRDKLRDMLAFYWSYQHVDKLESLRQRVLTGKSNAILATPAIDRPTNVAHYNARTLLAQFALKLEAASVVSFDLFDTLVARDIFDASDVPGQIELTKIASKHSASIDASAFLKARQAARNSVVKARSTLGQKLQ